MRPFLKWAGNKYQILNHIKQHLPQGKRLIEPFLGSGAVFLNTKFDKYLLGDSNPDLIQLFQHTKSLGNDFIDYCEQFFSPKYNKEKQYYTLRETFNETNDKELKSALFLYLNRHGFNGLCRYNSKSIFNVPFGEHRKPYFPRKEMFYFNNRAQTAKFYCSPFSKTMRRAKPGDIIYCDPPYVPLTETSSFTCYDGQSFDIVEQINLAKTTKSLTEKGVTVVISNHDTPVTRELYADATIISFPVKRSISATKENRRHVKELLAIFEPNEHR